MIYNIPLIVIGIISDMFCPILIYKLCKKDIPIKFKGYFNYVLYMLILLVNLLIYSQVQPNIGYIFFFYGIVAIALIYILDKKIGLVKSIFVTYLIVNLSRDFWEAPYLIYRFLSQIDPISIGSIAWTFKFITIVPVLYLMFKPKIKNLLILAIPWTSTSVLSTFLAFGLTFNFMQILIISYMLRTISLTSIMYVFYKKSTSTHPTSRPDVPSNPRRQEGNK